jgi:hypothetical protein
MGSLRAKNASEKFSRLGTFKQEIGYSNKLKFIFFLRKPISKSMLSKAYHFRIVK